MLFQMIKCQCLVLPILFIARRKICGNGFQIAFKFDLESYSDGQQTH